MSVKMRCRYCGRYNTVPDHFEAVKNYCASGGMIQTLTERVLMQPIHYHYVTPAPLWRAVAIALPQAFLAPSEVFYWHFDPLLTGGFAVFLFAVGLVIGSTEVEQTEIEDKPHSNDESEKVKPQPARFETITYPGKNSVSIQWPHEPPHDNDPKAQQRLYQADLALAKFAIDNTRSTPISWSEVKRRRMSIGEKTFYRIQHQWDKEALITRAASGAVYLNGHGRNVLSQYANR